MADHSHKAASALACIKHVAAAATVAGTLLSVQADVDINPPANAASPADLSPAITNQPVVKADAQLYGARVRAWREGASHILLLEGDARFAVGVYGFRGRRIVVRIDREVLPGSTVSHLSAYIDEARPLHDSKAKLRADAQRLLVTASTSGEMHLGTDLFTSLDAAPADPLIHDAFARMARHQAAMARATLPAPTEPAYPAAAVQARDKQREARRAAREAAAQDTLKQIVTVDQVSPTASARQERTRDVGVLPTEGAVRYGADSMVYQRGQDGADDAILLIGNVRVMYEKYDQPRRMTLKAEKVVIFLRDGESELANGSADAGSVTGVYLEDNAIVTDGAYTVRAPRVFYDMANNKAILLEAVLYTYDMKRNIPLYVRADVMKQTAAKSFEANDATLTTSEFGEPHFAIRADRITVEQTGQRTAAGDTLTHIAADDITMRWGDLPVFYWPHVAGTQQDIPLRRIRAGYSDNNGAELQTRWDLFSMLGTEAPDGVDVDLDLDFLGDHGPATGLQIEYEDNASFGELSSYLLLDDNGTDEIGGREDIDQDGETRGYAQWQHRHQLADTLQLSLEAAYVSDETFLEEFFRSEAATSKEYETSAYLKQQEANWAVDFLAKTDLSDFTAQTTLLQSPGYTVDRAPQASHHLIADSMWNRKLTWYSQTSVGHLKINAGDDTPEDRGFNNRKSMDLFGIPNTTSFQDRADAMGLPDDWVTRVDTRQEIAAPLKVGGLNLTPYAVGRATAYDQDFEDFNGDNDDQLRLWGGGGVRLHTAFTKVDNDAKSELLDVNRMRHIIEPAVDIFWAETSLDATDLPVYDSQVESLAQGGVFALGVTNTWQTQRGGAGRWHNTDWIKLNTFAVFRSDELDPDAEIPRYFDFRPEYAIGGDHLYSDLLWMLTDTFGLNGEVTYSLESDEFVTWRVGGTLDHGKRLRLFGDYEEIQVLDERLLSYGFSYTLTTKYQLGVTHRLDFSENDSRNISINLDRRLPRWILRIAASVDEVDNEQTVGILLIPEGFGGGGRTARLFDSRGGNS